jgi:hypothetical protein
MKQNSMHQAVRVKLVLVVTDKYQNFKTVAKHMYRQNFLANFHAVATHDSPLRFRAIVAMIRKLFSRNMTHSSLDYISLVIPRADSLHFLEN